MTASSRMPPALNIIALATFSASLVRPCARSGVAARGRGFFGQHRDRRQLRRRLRLHLCHHPARAGRRRRHVRQGPPDGRLPGAAGPRQHSRRGGDVVSAAVCVPHSGRHRLGWRVSDRAGADQRSRRAREAADRDRAHAGGRHDRQSARRFGVRPDRRLSRLARRARRAGPDCHAGLDRGGRRISRSGADASAADQPVSPQARLSHDLHQPERAHLLLGGLYRRLLRARAVSLHRRLPVRTRRNLAFDRRYRHRGLCGRRAVLHHDGVALSAAGSASTA